MSFDYNQPKKIMVNLNSACSAISVGCWRKITAALRASQSYTTLPRKWNSAIVACLFHKKCYCYLQALSIKSIQNAAGEDQGKWGFV